MNKNTRKKKAAAAAESFGQLLARLGIVDWDVVVFGDGSGSAWGKSCAWASVAVERDGTRRVWWGGANSGTIDVAETMAVLWPLLWLAARETALVEGGGRRRQLRVHVVSDSQSVTARGDAAAPPAGKNAMLWTLLRSLTRQGIVLEWHWIRRNTADLHAYADQLSRMVRAHVQAYNEQESVSANDGAWGGTAYEMNPNDPGGP
jgi:ribonuclease HI